MSGIIGPVSFSYEELLLHRENGVPREALSALRAEVDKIISEPTYDVTQCKIPRPSGDIHDYASMAIYWWPNPDTPDGLPYVMRDGVVNPETNQRRPIATLYKIYKMLALATFYFGEDKYAEYAERQLRAWYIDPETRMNPNARHAQMCPGRTLGSGYGMIDFGTSFSLFDGLGILECMGKISEDTLFGVRAWFSEFLNWILTDEAPLLAGNCTSNHGSWHDANVLSIAVGISRPEVAKRICRTAYDNRLRRQIEPGGAMPAELKRTKGMGYTFYNLRALTVIANIAERLGYKEYWLPDKQRGVSILKEAIDFIYPYVKNPETFPYRELYPNKHGVTMANMLLAVDKRFPGEGYAERAEEFEKAKADISRLYPSV